MDGGSSGLESGDNICEDMYEDLVDQAEAHFEKSVKGLRLAEFMPKRCRPSQPPRPVNLVSTQRKEK